MKPSVIHVFTLYYRRTILKFDQAFPRWPLYVWEKLNLQLANILLAVSHQKVLFSKLCSKQLQQQPAAGTCGHQYEDDRNPLPFYLSRHSSWKYVSDTEPNKCSNKLSKPCWTNQGPDVRASGKTILKKRKITKSKNIQHVRYRFSVTADIFPQCSTFVHAYIYVHSSSTVSSLPLYRTNRSSRVVGHWL